MGSGRVLWHLGSTAEASAAAFTQSYRECQRAAYQHEPTYRLRGLLTDGCDSTTNSRRTRFPGARLGFCLRLAPTPPRPGPGSSSPAAYPGPRRPAPPPGAGRSRRPGPRPSRPPAAPGSSGGAPAGVAGNSRRERASGSSPVRGMRWKGYYRQLDLSVVRGRARGCEGVRCHGRAPASRGWLRG
jgi:hypothetical protein